MKKQGFTLFELLAVIVILAIIVLIATPTILGVIEKAKKGSFKNSVYGLIDSANLYVTEHLESSSLTFTCDGKSCSSKDGGKLSFKGSVPKSGNIIVDSKQKVSVETITDGTYCATGTLENLTVEKGCNNLDTTAPTMDENGLVLTSTTNSITVKIAENFAKDPESGIKEYKVTVNGETKILKEVGSLTFTGLKKETEYSVEINVFNNKNLNNKLIKKIITKNFDNPSITLTNTPITAVNGYLKSQVAKITYNGTNISSPKYFVKTTREGTSSLAVTKSCGTGTTPSTCTNVTSTKKLTANTWYQVSGNVNVTYSDASDTTGTVYAITYDGTNYSGASTATISKIKTKAIYKVNHYLMNLDGTNYTLKETQQLESEVEINVTPNVKNYSGFTAPNSQSVKVRIDDSSVINYYYTRNKYRVTINKGTGINQVSGAGEYFYGATVNIGYTLLTGYHFVNWTGDQNTNSFVMTNKNITITANGAANVYYVSYLSNGGSGTMATTTCTYGVSCTLRSNTFVRSGYTFKGWSGSNGIGYSNGQTITNLTATNGATITMTARWALAPISGSISAPGVAGYFSDVNGTALKVAGYSSCTMNNVSGGSVIVCNTNHCTATQLAYAYRGSTTFSVAGYSTIYVYGGNGDSYGTAGTITYTLTP